MIDTAEVIKTRFSCENHFGTKSLLGFIATLLFVNNTGRLLQSVFLQSMQNDAKGSGEAITKSEHHTIAFLQ